MTGTGRCLARSKWLFDCPWHQARVSKRSRRRGRPHTDGQAVRSPARRKPSTLTSKVPRSGDVILIDSQNSLCSLATLASLTVYPPASQHGVFAHSRPLGSLSACGVPPRRARVGVAHQKLKTPPENRRGFYSGDVLLSHGLSPYYHRGCSVSLPCSEWERVVPLR